MTPAIQKLLCIRSHFRRLAKELLAAQRGERKVEGINCALGVLHPPLWALYIDLGGDFFARDAHCTRLEI